MEGEQMATKTKHTKGRVEVHEGEDYVVVMGKNHTTDNYLARVDTVANAKHIALTWNTFDQAREALKDACLTYAVHGDQPPQKWLDAIAAMEDAG